MARAPSPAAPDPLVSEIEVDGVCILVHPFGGIPPRDRLVLVKPPGAVEAYRRLMADLTPRCMVELGIAYGGSVALHALQARPDVYVALDISTERVALLDEVIDQKDLSGTVQLHYGVDQADTSLLRSTVTAALAGRPLDLVIDDASHLYGPSVTSFEALFPLVRPGGVYVIEDWTSDHELLVLLQSALGDPDSPFNGWANDVVSGRDDAASSGRSAQLDVARDLLNPSLNESGRPTRPLSRIASQLALGPANPGSGIESVSLNRFWIAVERSAEPLDPATFSLAAACADPFGSLAG